MVCIAFRIEWLLSEGVRTALTISRLIACAKQFDHLSGAGQLQQLDRRNSIDGFHYFIAISCAMEAGTLSIETRDRSVWRGGMAEVTLNDGSQASAGCDGIQTMDAWAWASLSKVEQPDLQSLFRL